MTHLPRHYDDESAASMSLDVGRGMSEVMHKLGKVGFAKAVGVRCMRPIVVPTLPWFSVMMS